MRLLITGGTGFIGRATVVAALGRGTAVGLLTRGAPASVPSGVEIFPLGRAPWTEEAIAGAMERFSPSTILHLAGGPTAGSVEELFEANVFLCHRLFDAARNTSPDARIVVAGSAAEYGPPLGADGRSREDDIARPVSAYGVAKLAQTLHSMIAARSGQAVVAARLFNPVGPGMPRGLAFADFAHQIAAGSSQLATGDIDTQRDFMPVDEAGRILLDLFAADTAPGRIVNVCSGRPQAVRSGVEHMLASAGRDIELIVQGDARPGGVPTIFGDTGQLDDLGIAPASADIGPALDSLLREVAVQFGTITPANAVSLRTAPLK